MRSHSSACLLNSSELSGIGELLKRGNDRFSVADLTLEMQSVRESRSRRVLDLN